MTAVEALERMALEFEHRRAKLSSAAASARIDARRSQTDAAKRAASVFASELQVQINEVTWAINRLRERARSMRSEEAA
jgi:hypothetical protein